MLKLGGVMLGSERPDKLVDFYEGIFGEPSWKSGDFTGFDVGGASLMIGPHSDVHGNNHEPGRIIFDLETEDVQGEFKHVTGAGAEVVEAPYHPGEAPDMWLATLSDPDGNYFQLYTPMEMQP